MLIVVIIGTNLNLHDKKGVIRWVGSYLLLNTIFHWVYSVVLSIVFCTKSIVTFVRLANPEARSMRYDKTRFALVTRRPYCPRRPKKLCFTTPSLAVETMGVRLGVVKQSFFGLTEQYGRCVTRANRPFSRY